MYFYLLRILSIILRAIYIARIQKTTILYYLNKFIRRKTKNRICMYAEENVNVLLTF